MSSQPQPVILQFDVDDKGGVKISNINKGLERMDKTARATASGGLRAMDAGLGRLKAGLAGLAAGVTLGATVGMINRTAKELDVLAKRAYALALTTEELSELGYAANLAGISSDQLGQSMKRLAQFSGQVSTGGKEAAATLERMGIEANAFMRASAGQRLEMVADGLSKMTNSAERSAAAVALFGREGLAMINMLDGGAAGLRSMRDEAQRLGASIDSDLAGKAEAFNDALTRVGVTLKDSRNRLVEGFLLPAAIEANTLANQWAELNARMGNTSDIVPALMDVFPSLFDSMFEVPIQAEKILIGFSDLTDGIGNGIGEAAQEMQIAVLRAFSVIEAGARKTSEIIAAMRNPAGGAMGFGLSGMKSIAADLAGGPSATKSALDIQIDKIEARHAAINKANEEAAKQRAAERSAQISGLDYQLEQLRDINRAAAEGRAAARKGLEDELLGNVELRRQKLQQLAAMDDIDDKAKDIANADAQRLFDLEMQTRELNKQADALARNLRMQQGALAAGNVPGPLGGNVGGVFGTFGEFGAQREMLMELEAMQAESIARQIELQEMGSSEAIRIAEQNAARQIEINRARNAAILGLTAGLAGETAATMENYARATGKKSREMALAQKGLAIGQATINTYLAASAAMASSAVLGPVAAAAAAKIIVALGLANVALIAATPLETYHDGGLVTGPGGGQFGGRNLRADEVPAVLQTGEVVLSRADVAMMTGKSGGSAAASGGGAGGVVYTVVLRGEEFDNWAYSRAGRRAINTVVEEEKSR